MKHKTLRAIALICAVTMFASLPAFAAPADTAAGPAEVTEEGAGTETDVTSGTTPAAPTSEAASAENSGAGAKEATAAGETSSDEAGDETAAPSEELPADADAPAEELPSDAADPAEELPSDAADPAEELPSDTAEAEAEDPEDEILTEEIWDMPLNGDGESFFIYDNPSDPNYVLVYEVLSSADKTVAVTVAINPSKSNVAVKIPKTVTNDGVTYTVTAMGKDNRDTGHAFTPDDFARIKSISFPDTMRTIPGNIFNWRHTKSASETEMGLPVPGNQNAYISELPVTSDTLASIPAFISKNYKDGCYYAGKCLVRVDPNYSGDLKVKDGTICILASALQGCSKIKKVTLPDSVEFIGMYAFADSSVTSVNLPKNLQVDTDPLSWKRGYALSCGTFCGCSKLKTVTIQCSTLGEIPQNCFLGCKALTGFDFSKVNNIWGWAFAGAFAKGTKLTIPSTVYMDYFGMSQFLGAGMSELTIDTRGIPTKAFGACPNLTKVTLGKNVDHLGTYGFYGCSALANDVLKGTNVTGIRHKSLSGTAMKELTVPASVNSIDGGVFTNNTALETVNWYPERTNFMYLTQLFALLNDGDMNSAHPSNDFKSIYSFRPQPDGTNIKTVNLYGNAEGESSSFGFLQMLPTVETINIKYPAPALADQFAYGDIALKKLTFDNPEALKSIGMHALSLTGLEEVVLPKGVKFGLYVFQGDQYLKKVVAEEDVTELGDFMFDGCPALEEVSLPESLKKVNWASFKNAGSGASVYLPAALELVEDDAFAVTDGAAHGLKILMAGDPQIETIHPLNETQPPFDEQNDKVALPSDVNCVYTKNGSNYQAYKAYLAGQGATAPTEGVMPQTALDLEISYSGEPVEYGSKVDASKVTVKADGKTLAKTDYEVVAPSTFNNKGMCEIRIKLDPEKFGDAQLTRQMISATLIYSEAKEGPVYDITSADNGASYKVKISRFISVAGGNRYKTAAAIAVEAFPTGPSEAILVTGEKFPDALAANAYAGAKGAPILMSKLKELPAPTKDLLTKTWGKSVKTVTIIGGGFDKKVESDLKACGVTTIKHIAGKNRYKTAEEVCKAGFAENLWLPGVPIAVATGQSPADALAFSPWSYGAQVPILLVKNGEASASTKALIAKFEYAFLLGSSSVVKDSCLSASQKSNHYYYRMAGSNRYKTSLAIADYFTRGSMGSYSNAAYADGTDAHFPDALVGGMLQGKLEAPIILTKPGQKDVLGFTKSTMNKSAYVKDPVYFLGWSAKGKSSEYGELTKLLKQ